MENTTLTTSTSKAALLGAGWPCKQRKLEKCPLPTYGPSVDNLMKKVAIAATRSC